MDTEQKTDADIQAVRDASNALKASTSRRMLRANLEFLWDYFMTHPSKELPNHLLPAYLKNPAPKQD